MAVQQPSLRRFAVMGTNTFNIANKLMSNQNLCRLLKYLVRDPLDEKKYKDVDGVELLNKQIMIVPKIFDDSTEKTSYVVAMFSGFNVNAMNPDYKLSTVRFDVACPYDEWVLDYKSLRPYMMMQEIDDMFNLALMAGIGTLQFVRADSLVLTPQIGGYSMLYRINEFN